MTDQRTDNSYETESVGARQRAIEAYEGARDRASDTFSQAPLIALAGGIAAGALIAALLPRTEMESRAIYISQTTEDTAEKRRSFIEKRRPDFKNL